MLVWRERSKETLSSGQKWVSTTDNRLRLLLINSSLSGRPIAPSARLEVNGTPGTDRLGSHASTIELPKIPTANGSQARVLSEQWRKVKGLRRSLWISLVFLSKGRTLRLWIPFEIERNDTNQENIYPYKKFKLMLINRYNYCKIKI